MRFTIRYVAYMVKLILPKEFINQAEMPFMLLPKAMNKG